MIISNGDFVSDIRNSLKALNKDDHISARYILSLAHPFVSYIINNRVLFKFFRDKSVFSTGTCIEMKPLKSYDCCVAEFKNCDKMMISKKQLPKILQIKSGAAVEFVTSMTNGTEYEPLRNIVDWQNNKKRQFGNLFKFYYIADDYLYLLNSTSELVSVSAAFLEEDELKKLSACKEKDSEEDCKSKLDNKFICPEEYVSSVRAEVLNIILNRARITQDENPDLDQNQKTRTN